MAVYLKPDKSKICGGVKVNEYFLHNHNTNRIDLPTAKINGLMGVTIHNTEWIKVNPNTTPAEQYTRATVNGNMNTVRVHYYVDNVCAWQNLDTKYTSWHAADGNGNGNMRTISIECIMDKSSNSYNAKSRDNCARLAAYLLWSNNLTVDNLYTHTYWLNVRDGKGQNLTKDERCVLKHSYKTCPLYIIPKWAEFVALVDKYVQQLGGKSIGNNKPTTVVYSGLNTAFTPYRVKILDNSFNVRKNAGVNNPIVCVVKRNEVYTIVEEKNVVNADGSKAVWGKLKSGIGWINVEEKYVKKV